MDFQMPRSRATISHLLLEGVQDAIDEQLLQARVDVCGAQILDHLRQGKNANLHRAHNTLAGDGDHIVSASPQRMAASCWQQLGCCSLFRDRR